MKYIAVKDCVLVLSSGVGIVKIETLESEKAKIEGKGIYSGELIISISSFTSSVCSLANSGVGVGVLIPTATKTKVENKFVVREGDFVQITVNGKDKTSLPVIEIVTVTILKAGQEKVKAN